MAGRKAGMMADSLDMPLAHKTVLLLAKQLVHQR